MKTRRHPKHVGAAILEHIPADVVKRLCAQARSRAQAVAPRTSKASGRGRAMRAEVKPARKPTKMKAQLEPDREQAERFLALLDPDATSFTF
jgi:hypothetical protein